MPREPSSKELLQQAINSGKIHHDDGRHFQEFLQYYTTIKRLSNRSKTKYEYCVRQFLERIRAMDRHMAALDEKDALRLIRWLQDASWSEDTKADYWDRFTRVYEWASARYGPWQTTAAPLLAGPKKYVYRIDKNKVEKKGTLTPEEILRIVHLEPDLSYKVFFAVTYEGGMRAGEAFSLRLRDVERHKTGRTYTLHVRQSKTEKRPIPLIHFSTAYLEKWLTAHPHKANPDAPLFTNTLGDPLRNETANKRLRQLLVLAQLNKRKISLHSLRHSRATELAGVLNEFQMCRLFGWNIGSRMPATYIREGAIDVRGALLKGYGMEKEEAHKIEGRACLQCEHLNPADAEYCDNCSLPLDAQRIEKLKADVDTLRSQDLLKRLLREARADLIRDVVRELKAEQRTKP